MPNKITVQHFSGSHDAPLFASSLTKNLHPDNDSIKILMIGDVVGRAGRKVLKKVLPLLTKAIKIDFMTINGENLAGGFGITEKIYHEIKSMGIDAITMGNHWKDKPDVHNIRAKYQDIILPRNLMGVSDIGSIPSFYLEERKKNICIINLMGNYGMKEKYYNPFDFLLKEKELLAGRVKSGSYIVIADIHAEASSEKQAIAWAYDGIFAGLIGTHTHTPTSDERITAKGTAFLTDVGMTGSYDSVIGMNKERVIKRLSRPEVKIAHEVAENDLWFCGFLIEVSPQTNMAIACHRLQYRNDNAESWTISSCLTISFSG